MRFRRFRHISVMNIRYRLDAIILSTWLRNFGVLVGGNGLALGIGFLGSMVTARLYSPADFGSVAVLTSVISWIGYVAAMRLDTAVLAEKSEDEVTNTVYAAMVATVISTAVMSIMMTAFWVPFCKYINAIYLVPYYWVVIICVFLSTVASTLRYWTTKRGLFVLQTKTLLSSAIASPATSVTLGVFHVGVVGLIMGMIFGSIAGTTKLIRSFIRTDTVGYSTQGVVNSFARNRALMVYGIPQAILNGVFVFGNPIWISSLFGQAFTGQYSLASRVILVPIGLLTGAISQLLMNEFSSALENNRKMLPVWMNNLIRLAYVALLPLCIIAFTAQLWLPFVFGRTWRQAAYITQLLAPMYAISLLVSPLHTVLIIIRRQRTMLCLDILRVGVISVWYWYSRYSHISSGYSMVLFSYSVGSVYIVWAAVTYYMVWKYDNRRT